MWKFHNFSVTQILREINLGDSRSSKIAVLAILGALKMIILVNFKCKKSLRSQFKAYKCIKIADFALLKSQKLISRKI